MKNPTPANPAMTDNLLFEHFATLATAPEGIARLRELILQLAVQGKLGTQDAGDETASVLLKKIREVKERLVKEKKLQKEKPLKSLTETDEPFNIPKNWIWTYFGQIIFNRDGERIPIEKAERSTRHGSYDYYGASGVIDSIDGYLFDKSLLLIGEDGANLVNRSTPIAFIAHGKYWVNNHAHVLDGISLEFLRYLEIYINSIDLRPYLTGMAQPKMNQAKMNSIPVPLPPLAEQHRIVTKVDRFMALCDELEARQQQERAGCLKLGTASLAGLQNAESPEEFGRQWAQVCDAFDLVLDCPENVAVLRQTILQLAVQGRLVWQEMGDEPADMLVERIRKEKERLVKEGKIKRDSRLELIDENDIGQSFPQNWVLTRLGEIAYYNAEIKVSSEEISEESWVFDLEDIEKDTSRILQKVRFKDRQSLSSKSRFKKGDVLYGKLRPYLNKVVVADEDGYCTTEIVPIRPYLDIDPKYLMYALKTPSFLSYVNSKTYGIKMPRLGTVDAINTVVPLPPLAEQHRIVAKVDALMALCDALESQLKERAGVQERFAKAVGKQVAG